MTNITGLGNEAISLTESVSVSDANAINALTTGAVTATISDGDMSTLAGLTETGNVYTITVTDASVSASALTTLAGKTTGAVTASAVTSVTGSVSELSALYAVTDITGLGNEAISLTESVSVSNANTVNALTTGAVTATISDGDMSTLAGLTETGNAYAITVTDTNVSASALTTLAGKTTGAVTASAVTSVTGSVSELSALYAATNITSLGNEAISFSSALSVSEANIVSALTDGAVTATISDGDMSTLAGLTETGNAYTITVTDTTGVSASALTTLAGKTTVDVDASNVNSLTGSTAEINAALSSESGIAGLNNAIPILQVLSVSQANAASSVSASPISAVISEGDLSTLAGLTETGNVYTITVTDTSVSASALTTLAGKTTLALCATL